MMPNHYHVCSLSLLAHYNHVLCAHETNFASQGGDLLDWTSRDGGIQEESFIQRIEALSTMGYSVLLSNYSRYFSLASYLSTFTQQSIVISMGIPSVRVCATLAQQIIRRSLLVLISSNHCTSMDILSVRVCSTPAQRITRRSLLVLFRSNHGIAEIRFELRCDCKESITASVSC